MKKYKRKAQQYQKSVITIARNAGLWKSHHSVPANTARLKLRHGPCRAIPWTFNSIRGPPSVPPRRPFLSPGLHQHQVRMSRIEVQRSNSRNKIIAITIAISSRTTEPWWVKGRGVEGGGSGTRRGEREGDGEGRLPQRAELQSTLMSCSHPRAPPAPFRCRRQFVVEASGITQMRLFSGRNVHSATKPVRAPRRVPRTELKTGVEERRWKVPLSAAIVLLRPPRAPRRGQYFLCWKPARRRMDFHRCGVWALQERNSFLSDTRSLARIGISRRNDRCSF